MLFSVGNKVIIQDSYTRKKAIRYLCNGVRSPKYNNKTISHIIVSRVIPFAFIITS